MDRGNSSSPYIPNTDADRLAMLQATGVGSAEDLFKDIPVDYVRPSLNIPAPLSELELRRELQALSDLNLNTGSTPSFLGGGAYHHFIPAAVSHIASRGELATSYTPYQPEVAQGTLQITYEFQSLVSQIMGMDVANAGMYEGATALAEAALMACRITSKERIAVLDTVSPANLSVIKTYTEPQGLDVYLTSPGSLDIREGTACLVTQNPNFYGYLEEMEHLEKSAHDEGALLVVSTDPVFLGMFHSPGDYGADIAVAEGQPLGVPLSYGGPLRGPLHLQVPVPETDARQDCGQNRRHPGKDGIRPDAPDQGAAHPAGARHLQHLHQRSARGNNGGGLPGVHGKSWAAPHCRAHLSQGPLHRVSDRPNPRLQPTSRRHILSGVRGAVPHPSLGGERPPA